MEKMGTGKSPCGGRWSRNYRKGKDPDEEKNEELGHWKD